MITLFTIPKPFTGQFDKIQRNAIGSWTMPRPRPEIILLGDDAGAGELAAGLGLIHLPGVGRNRQGTPTLDSAFSLAESTASHGLLAYVNADILLLGGFLESVARISATFPENANFLLIGRKRIIPLESLIDFGSPRWEEEPRLFAKDRGTFGTSDTDYFVFRRGLWRGIPPFAIGRSFWSGWLVSNALHNGNAVVDCTAAITALEPRHDYSHVSSRFGHGILDSDEVAHNARLMTGSPFYTTVNASHGARGDGVRPAPWYRKLLALPFAFDHATLRTRAVQPWYAPILKVFYAPIRPVVPLSRKCLLNRAP